MSNTKMLLHEAERTIRDLERELKKLYKVRDLLGGTGDVSPQGSPKQKRTQSVADWTLVIEEVREAIASLPTGKPFSVTDVHERVQKLGGKWSEATTRKVVKRLATKKEITYDGKHGRTHYWRLDAAFTLSPPKQDEPKKKRKKNSPQLTNEQKGQKVYDAMVEMNGRTMGLRVMDIAKFMDWEKGRVLGGLNHLVEKGEAYHSGDTSGGDKQGRPARLFKLRTVVVHAGEGIQPTGTRYK